MSVASVTSTIEMKCSFVIVRLTYLFSFFYPGCEGKSHKSTTLGEGGEALGVHFNKFEKAIMRCLDVIGSKKSTPACSQFD